MYLYGCEDRGVTKSTKFIGTVEQISTIIMYFDVKS